MYVCMQCTPFKAHNKLKLCLHFQSLHSSLCPFLKFWLGFTGPNRLVADRFKTGAVRSNQSHIEIIQERINKHSWRKQQQIYTYN